MDPFGDQAQPVDMGAATMQEAPAAVAATMAPAQDGFGDVTFEEQAVRPSRMHTYIPLLGGTRVRRSIYPPER